jgi:hypothetical protein
MCVCPHTFVSLHVGMSLFNEHLPILIPFNTTRQSGALTYGSDRFNSNQQGCTMCSFELVLTLSPVGNTGNGRTKASISQERRHRAWVRGKLREPGGCGSLLNPAVGRLWEGKKSLWS